MSINARWKIQEFADIVDLSDAEIHSIQTEIPDLPKELERHGAIVLTEGLTEIKTRLELDGFYFAFRVVIGNTTFKRSCSFEQCTIRS